MNMFPLRTHKNIKNLLSNMQQYKSNVWSDTCNIGDMLELLNISINLKS